MLPFTPEQFVAVFARYNDTVWPAQVVAYVLGIVAVLLALQPRPWSGRVASAVLGALWLFVGIAYQLVFYRPINPAAGWFGVLFAIEGALLLARGTLLGRLAFTPTRGVAGIAGASAVLYAMLLYPLLGLALGHVYPRTPTFGITPCPLTIYTLGMLLWIPPPRPRWLFAIPVLWSLLGLPAAFQLGFEEDLGMTVTGVVAVALLFLPRAPAPAPLPRTVT